MRIGWYGEGYIKSRSFWWIEKYVTAFANACFCNLIQNWDKGMISAWTECCKGQCSLHWIVIFDDSPVVVVARLAPLFWHFVRYLAANWVNANDIFYWITTGQVYWCSNCTVGLGLGGMVNVTLLLVRFGGLAKLRDNISRRANLQSRSKVRPGYVLHCYDRGLRWNGMYQRSVLFVLHCFIRPLTCCCRSTSSTLSMLW